MMRCKQPLNSFCHGSFYLPADLETSRKLAKLIVEKRKPKRPGGYSSFRLSAVSDTESASTKRANTNEVRELSIVPP